MTGSLENYFCRSLREDSDPIVAQFHNHGRSFPTTVEWHFLKDSALEEFLLFIETESGSLHLDEKVGDGLSGGGAIDVIPFIKQGCVLPILDSGIRVPKSGLHYDFQDALSIFLVINVYDLSRFLEIAAERLLVNLTRFAYLLQIVALHNGHFVHCQGTCFIRANIGCTSHGLTRFQPSDKVVLLGHDLTGKAEGDCHGKRKSFGDGTHDNADSDDEGV